MGWRMPLSPDGHPNEIAEEIYETRDARARVARLCGGEMLLDLVDRHFHVVLADFLTDRALKLL